MGECEVVIWRSSRRQRRKRRETEGLDVGKCRRLPVHGWNHDGGKRVDGNGVAVAFKLVLRPRTLAPDRLTLLWKEMVGA